MPNYYEILNIQPGATRTEIEQSLDAQYNKLRQLVTHHDPNIVNRANFGLQTLEKIRSVLIDDGKRSAYDAAISNNMGGPADPTSNSLLTNSLTVHPMRGTSPSQSAPRYLPQTQASAQRIWACPKCQSPNAVNSQFCKKCGESLASLCPSCNSLVEKNSQFCANCGVNVAQAQRKKELDDELRKYQVDLNIATKNVPVSDGNLPDLKNNVVSSGAWAIVAFIAGLVYSFAIPGHFPGLNLTGLVLAISGDTSYLPVSMKDSMLSGIGIVTVAVITLFLALVTKVSPVKGLGAAIAALLFMTLPYTVQSTLIMAGVLESIATGIAAIVTTFAFVVLSIRLMFHAKNGFQKLKPYYSWLPGLGCFGELFTLLLIASPILLSLYLVILAVSGKEMVLMMVNNSGFYFWLTNAIQFFIVAIALAGTTLLSWRTFQSIETRHLQAVMQRSEKIKKLTQRIQILEQAVNKIDLRSQ